MDSIGNFNTLVQRVNDSTGYDVTPTLSDFECIFNGSLTEDSPRNLEPAGFKDIRLKLHQLTAIFAMQELEKSEYRWYPGANVGFLSDSVGSGKSFTMLGHLMTTPILEYKNVNKTERSHHVTFLGLNMEIKNWIQTNLLVVSHTVFNQWIDYLSKTNINYMTINRHADFPDELMVFKQQIIDDNIHVILIKSNLYNDFIDLFIVDNDTDADNTNTNSTSTSTSNNMQPHTNYDFAAKTIIKNPDLIHAIGNDYTSIITHRGLIEDKINTIQKKFMAWTRTNLITDHILTYAQDTTCIKEAIRNIRTSFDELENITMNNFQYNTIQTFVNNNTIEYCLQQKGKWGFNRIIVDEVDTVNIPSSRYMHARFYWFITNNVENVLFPCRRKSHYLYGKLGDVIPCNITGMHNIGFFKTLFNRMNTASCCYSLQIHRTFIRNVSDYVHSSFSHEIPPMVNFNYYCEIPGSISAIADCLPSHILVYLHAGNWEGAISALQPSERDVVVSECDFITQLTYKLKIKCDKEKKKVDDLLEHTLHIRSTIEKHEAHINNANHVLLAEYEHSENSNNRTAINTLVLENKRILLKNTEMDLLNHTSEYNTIRRQIENIQSRVRDDLANSHCPICLSVVGRPAFGVPCCQHIFCMSCLTSALQIGEKCPCCRMSLTIQMCLILEERYVERKHELPMHIDFANFLGNRETRVQNEIDINIDKPEVLKQLLEYIYNDVDRKILIFFEYDRIIEMKIVPWLREKNMNFDYLNGSSGTIGKRIEQFKRGASRILLLNAKYFGVGLNLQMATDLIVFHRMTNAMERQIIGRAQRIGRVSPLQVHWLLYRGFEDISSNSIR